MVRNALLGFVAFLVIGNLIIALAWQWQAAGATEAGPIIRDVENFRVVDDRVWRGAAPSRRSYADLATAGVTTVVDLRAEDYVDIDEPYLRSLGLDLVRIEIRDGQTPSDEQVHRFLATVEESSGPVFVHCGAGVGRTGTLVAAYEVTRRGTSALEALRRNLTVGPPSLEQLAFAARLESGFHQPNIAVVAVSRVLDAPRRIWSQLRS